MPGLPYVRTGSGVKIEVEGMQHLLDVLNDSGSPARLRRFALRALVPAAKLERAAIRSEAPVAPKDTVGRYAHKRGALKAGVRYKASRQKTAEGGKIIAYIVGPFGKGTSQRHLVISGHKITGHHRMRAGQYEVYKVTGKRGQKTAKATGFHDYAIKMGHRELARGGEMTRPNPFVQRGAAKVESQITRAMEQGAKEAFDELAKGKP